jgi:hypothetical protein
MRITNLKRMKEFQFWWKGLVKELEEDIEATKTEI